jgi:trans-2,3-dihydro-3-hydroxyanthranilate isomerase
MARTYDFVTLDVFTAQRFGGNPLAVLPDAAGLSGAEMQAIAGEFNLSETAFVLPPSDPSHTAHVRIFTPRSELPFAGHPNVGTGWVLTSRGLDRDGVLLFEEAAGLVRVEVERAGEAVASVRVAAPRPLTVGDGPTAAVVATCAGLEARDLATTHPPLLAGTGNTFLIAPVTAEALGRAAPDTAAFQAAAAADPHFADRRSLYLYARDGAQVRARMFGPLDGIPEDPATGSAATALAALLLHLDGGESLDLAISQGDEMNRPSRLRAGARRGADGVRAWVGGGCVPVMEGRLSL